MSPLEQQRLISDLYDRLRDALAQFAAAIPKGEITQQELNRTIGVAITMLLAEAYPVTMKRRLSEQEHRELVAHLRDELHKWLKAHPPAGAN